MVIKKLDHVGIAIENGPEAQTLWERLIGTSPSLVEEVPAQGVRAHFLPAGEAKLELLEALNEDSAVASFIAKRGPGLHHLAFEVPNINRAWKEAGDAGFQRLGDGPTSGAGNKDIFFLHPRNTGGVLVEFCQKRQPTLTPTMIPFAGGSLAVYELGDRRKPTVVVLHGAAGSTLVEMGAFVQRLGASHHVLALDFAGHGRSDIFPDQPFTPELFQQNVQAVYDHFGLDQAVLMGFSMGGFIGLTFTYHHPERVSRLITHATNLAWDQPLIDKMMVRLDHKAFSAQPELATYLSDVHGDWVSLFERMKAYTRNIPTFGYRFDHLDAIKLPVLVSAVDKDDLFEVTSPTLLYQHLPNAQLAVLPGSRHAFQNVDLDQYMPVFRRFIGK